MNAGNGLFPNYYKRHDHEQSQNGRRVHNAVDTVGVIDTRCSVKKASGDDTHNALHADLRTQGVGGERTVGMGSELRGGAGGSRTLHDKLALANAYLDTETKCLWDEFDRLGTEMIVTKAGR